MMKLPHNKGIELSQNYLTKLIQMVKSLTKTEKVFFNYIRKFHSEAKLDKNTVDPFPDFATLQKEVAKALGKKEELTKQYVSKYLLSLSEKNAIKYDHGKITAIMMDINITPELDYILSTIEEIKHNVKSGIMREDQGQKVIDLLLEKISEKDAVTSE